MPTPSQLLFLPGASGNTQFWQPLADRLQIDASKVILGYPGFGSEPAVPDIHTFDDLVQYVVRHIDRPTALIAQSMGGVLAAYAALQKSDWVTHLVLSVTSGGIDMSGLDVQDWRKAMVDAHPAWPDWFVSFRSDITAELGRISQPVLLIWGDADPFSPVAVGKRLLELLPDAHLHVISGGQHDLAYVHASTLASMIDAHLASA